MSLLDWFRPASAGPVPTPALSPADATDMAVKLLRQFEGCVLHPYQDVAGVWTIGWGTTVIDGHPVTASTAPISQALADSLMETDAASRVLAVLATVKVPVEDCETAALVSFAYNEGLGAERTSTLLVKLNAGDRAGAADQFLLWDKVTEGGRLVVSAGLSKRRAKERAVFLGEQQP